jgi:penicillin-binding protein 1A
MREALRGQPDKPRAMPPGLVTVRISPTTGALAAANEAGAINETFMEDHQPQEGQPGNAVPATVPQNPNNGSEPLF